jgi:transposase
VTPKRSLKKNLAQKIKQNESAELLFFDEARFGTHSNLGYGWYPKGSRTAVKVKLGYKNFYVYGAANPLTGANFHLLLPKANTECMNIFIRELIKEFGGKKIILVLDGAGWHKSKNLEIPENITIVFLPPYSPELNPIERLWLHIKHHTIRNRIYDTLNDLEEAVCNFIKNLKSQTVESICRINYLFSYI